MSNMCLKLALLTLRDFILTLQILSTNTSSSCYVRYVPETCFVSSIIPSRDFHKYNNSFHKNSMAMNFQFILESIGNVF